VRDIFEDGDPFDDPHWQKTEKRKRKSERIIGCPLPWFEWIYPLLSPNSKAQVGMVLYLYRRCCICGSDTVTVPNNEISKTLGIGRWAKRHTLMALEEIGVLRILENGRATKTTKVQLCSWPDPPPPGLTR
jgi:hypothetical protein